VEIYHIFFSNRKDTSFTSSLCLIVIGVLGMKNNSLLILFHIIIFMLEYFCFLAIDKFVPGIRQWFFSTQADLSIPADGK
jgi:hypothetical protein